MTKFAIIDIETTGGVASNSKITEIAIIIYQNGEIIEEFESLINPECSIPMEITRITGITNEMVSEAPKFYEVAKKILEITHNCIFVAHNVNFDYSFIREEYKNLGFSFSRKRLCTVQLSKRYYPGLRSYSLGNLIKHFELVVTDRHRAMADAKATLTIFKLMLEIENKPDRIEKLIKGMVQTTRLPTHLPRSDIESLPEDCGVYYMCDREGRYVYIGKSINIKERIIQHFNESTFKHTRMMNLVYSIAYQLTGSELMACLLESAEIKIHSPEINRAQKNKTENWALIKDLNNLDYFYYKIVNTSNLEGHEEAVNLFKNSKAASQYLDYLIQEYNLCLTINQSRIEKLKPCSRHQLGFCLGACVHNESKEEYNNRFLQMNDNINRFFKRDMILIDKGRNNYEKSVLVIQNGFCIALGYLDFDQPLSNFNDILDSLSPYKGNIESNGIIRRFLNAKSSIKVQYI